MIILMCLAAVAVIWWKAKEAQERALKAARAYCKNLGLQLLDECVVQGHWHFRRGDSSFLVVERIYQFEFTSTGYERYVGEVIMRGAKLVSVHVEPHVVQY
ncbi:DUF3301 domain-containing protein [Neiella holothuriorum]|uniref:DUF3301 domain-containing protein n=1 Tax=Neiella holothuriorum TaxID=2870530 RepID=UPI00298FA9C7|nr:DUF3301 domain-containing protein [Neiella holothuriorum]